MELSCPPETAACAMLLGGGLSSGTIWIGCPSSSSDELLELGFGVSKLCRILLCGCCGGVWGDSN